MVISIISATYSPVVDTVSNLSQILLKSLFFLPVIMLLVVAFIYAVKSLKYLKRNTIYKKQIKLILDTKVAVNDYMSEVVYYLEKTVSRMQADLNSYIERPETPAGNYEKLADEYKSFKNSVDEMLASNQVSSARSTNSTKMITNALPNPFTQKPVWIPIVIALVLVLVLNCMFYFLKLLDVTAYTGLVTVGALLFPIVITAMTYNYLCYSRSQNKVNSQRLQQETDLYEQRVSYLKTAAEQLSSHVQSLRSKEFVSPGQTELQNYQQDSTILDKLRDGLTRTVQYAEINEATPRLDVSTLANRLVKDFQPRVDNKHLKADYSISSGILTRVRPDEMRQLIGSLLENAIIYSNPGGEISLEVDRRFNKFSISISDKGLGIPKQRLDTISKSFSVADEDRQSNRIIPGLNFMINRIIIAKLDASYKVVSTESVGTKVTLILPISRIAK